MGGINYYSYVLDHTSPGKCGPLWRATPNFSFDSCMCYQDKMIPCFIEIFEGKYEYWNSKSFIKPKYKLQPHLVLQPDILFKKNEIKTK